MPLFQSESKCETILMKIDSDLHENETACIIRFDMKGFTLRLVLKRMHKRTRKCLFVRNLTLVVDHSTFVSF